MVESVSGINSTTQIAAAASATEKVDTKAKQEETQKAKQEEKTDKVDKDTQTQVPMDRLRVRELVLQYIENLKKANDYPIVLQRLDMWVATFDVDNFIKKYPNLYTEQDLRSVMYNETNNLL
ncbi:MAG: hypothetical protein ACI4SM_05875 [Candidatus Gastranaerophilaceae bacterium]